MVCLAVLFFFKIPAEFYQHSPAGTNDTGDMTRFVTGKCGQR